MLFVKVFLTPRWLFHAPDGLTLHFHCEALNLLLGSAICSPAALGTFGSSLAPSTRLWGWTSAPCKQNYWWKCPFFLPPLLPPCWVTAGDWNESLTVGSVMWRIYGCSTIQVSGIGSWIHITPIAGVKPPLLCTAGRLRRSAWARARKEKKKEKGLLWGFVELIWL